MAAESRLTADLRKQIEEWQALATEARQRADQHRRGDLDPAYLYGLSERPYGKVKRPVLAGLNVVS